MFHGILRWLPLGAVVEVGGVEAGGVVEVIGRFPFVLLHNWAFSGLLPCGCADAGRTAADHPQRVVWADTRATKVSHPWVCGAARSVGSVPTGEREDVRTSWLQNYKQCWPGWSRPRNWRRQPRHTRGRLEVNRNGSKLGNLRPRRLPVFCAQILLPPAARSYLTPAGSVCGISDVLLARPLKRTSGRRSRPGP